MTSPWRFWTDKAFGLKLSAKTRSSKAIAIVEKTFCEYNSFKSSINRSVKEWEHIILQRGHATFEYSIF